MSILNKIFNLWRWHPEVAIRYWPIVKNLKVILRQAQDDAEQSRSIKSAKFQPKAGQLLAEKVKKLKILEVGSGWLGIAPYLGESIVGLDEDFEGKKFSLLKQVKGGILRIPFKRNSFDFVICVDVLEHLSEDKRLKAVEELLRVAKERVFLAIPCGKESYKQDVELDREYKKIFGKSFPFLAQHLKYKLPEKEDSIQLIKVGAERQKKKVKIKIQGNENLSLRSFLMKGWMTKNFLIDILFRKIFLILTPFLALFDKPPYYRQMFFVRIKR